MQSSRAKTWNILGKLGRLGCKADPCAVTVSIFLCSLTPLCCSALLALVPEPELEVFVLLETIDLCIWIDSAS